MRVSSILAAVFFVLPISALAAERPNIVFILADDLGYGDVGCYNPESTIPTPNLNRLAQQGMRFTDAHSPCTVCTPTRYSLMTGQMAFRVPRGGSVFTGAGGCEVATVAVASQAASAVDEETRARQALSKAKLADKEG